MKFRDMFFPRSALSNNDLGQPKPAVTAAVAIKRQHEKTDAQEVLSSKSNYADVLAGIKFPCC